MATEAGGLGKGGKYKQVGGLLLYKYSTEYRAFAQVPDGNTFFPKMDIGHVVFMPCLII